MHRSRARLVAALIGLLLVSSVAPAFGASRAELEKHQDRAARARKQAAQAERNADRLAKQVAALDKEIDRYESAANALQPRINEASERTRRIQRDVNQLTAEVDQTQAEIEATQAEYARQQKLLASRMESTYRQGEWFYLDLLLGSSNVSDLIERTDFVSRVIDSNNQIALDLERSEASLSRAKIKLDRSLSAVKVKKREAAEVEADLRNLQAERQQAANAAEAVQGQKADLMADNKRNAKRLRALAEQEEAESDKIAAQLGASNTGSGQYSGGSMSWPVPSSQRITSPFGWRICPFHGREMHPGIDIGASSGSTIVAAGSGTVIYAGYRGGYGNTVMIDHGNGVVTLYAHQSSISVGHGASVSRGQKIGHVGSTGFSTGPHLHFELRVNGSPRNPTSYM